MQFNTIFDKSKAFIWHTNIEIDLKNMQIFLKKIIYKAYIILASDIIFNLDLNQFSKLSCLQFTEYEDFSN